MSSWTQATGRRNDLYRLSGLFLCQKAIARLFFFACFHHLFSPQNDYCNKSIAGVCKLNQVEEESSFQTQLMVSVRETVFGFVFGSFTVGEVFACTFDFFCLIQLSSV